MTSVAGRRYERSCSIGNVTGGQFKLWPSRTAATPGDDRAETKRQSHHPQTNEDNHRPRKPLWGKRSEVIIQRTRLHQHTHLLTLHDRIYLRRKIVLLRRTDVAQANPRLRSHDLIKDLLSLFLFLLLLKKERGSDSRRGVCIWSNVT